MTTTPPFDSPGSAGSGKTYIANPDTDLVVTTELETAGLISYWRCGESMSLATLTDAWTAAGLDLALLPKSPEPETALRRAVMEQQERHRLVRALEKKAEWAIVDETVVEGKAPTYSTRAMVTFVAGSPTFLQMDAPDDEFRKLGVSIRAAFAAQQGLLASTDITTWLVKLAKKRNAVTLRDTGGVYFVPRDHVEFWRKVASCVEATAGFRVFKIPAMKNSEAVAAIVDAISAEAAQLADAMEAEMMATGDDALGKRALKTRQAEAEAMLAKVGDYQKLLGMEIAVRERIEALSASIAAAALTDDSEA